MTNHSTARDAPASENRSFHRRPDPEAVREALGGSAGEDAEEDPGELLVPARRCFACSAELNLRVTPALREAVQDLPGDTLLQTVLCKHYRRPGGTCGALVDVLAEDVQRAESR